MPSSLGVRPSARRLLSFAVAGLLAAGLSVVPIVGVSGTAVGAQAASAPSAAGSIVFVRNHNIWVARGNGTSATAVTKDGTSTKPYREPSMSNTGVIATVRDNNIVLLKQNGTVIRRIAVPKGHLYLNNGAGSFAVTGPVDAEISPDGSKVAYSQIRYATVSSWADVRTGFTDVSGLSPITKYGLLLGDEFSWLTNARGIFVSSNIHLYQLGSADQEGQLWFNQGDLTGNHGDTPGAPQVSPNRQLLAWTSYTSSGILLARVNGDPDTASPPAPSLLCEISPAGAQALEHPNFSPDSTTVLWQDRGTELRIAWNLQTDAGCAGAQQKVLLTNAGQADWSAASFNVTPEPKAKPKPKPKPKAKPKAVKVLKIKKRPTIKGVARVGRTLRATKGTWANKPRTYSFRWLRNNKAIKGKAGAKRTYVVRRADRGRRISVRVTVRKPGLQGKNTAVSKPVRVR